MKHDIALLVEKYLEFSTREGREGLKEFSVWLHHNLEQRPPEPVPAEDMQLDRDIAYLLNRLSRFSRFYTRKVLVKYGIISLDEFYFLLSISRLGMPSKNEVYKDAITDLPTGAQIMRRLSASGMIAETVDKKDKRVRRVRLTPKGIRIKQSIFNEFSETVRLKTGNMKKQEKETLKELLAGLHEFHTGIYLADADKPISYLLQKYIL